LQSKKEKLSAKLKKAFHLGKKWENEAKKHIVYNRVLKKELKKKNKGEASGLDILAQATCA
jgi:hypothetical protein